METEELSHGGDFFWENHSWGLSNSDNSGAAPGAASGSGSLEKHGKKLPDLSSNSPTPTQTPAQTPTGVTGGLKRGVPKGGSSECKGSGGGGDESDHEIHIWTERERRKKMRNMFSNLHALLPQLPAKADKSTIVDEAVSYIKTLQQTLQKLQKKKLDILRGATTNDYDPSITGLTPTPLTNTREAFVADQVSSRNMAVTTYPPHSLPVLPTFSSCMQTWSSPNVVLSVCGDDAQISVCAPKKLGLLTTILFVLEKHRLEVVTAHVSSDQYRSMYMIHAHVSLSF
ncbi:hypothetical protein GIB67_017580 [Kingdonia uniflora]|uniref:BHLH domain-containing protein n=1 Tax=Kingdonia uniflora TaxID=39325 RepID=A0A7J7LN42_9MAGN|nr:hypothetical protein GIB67_017580 [Kingdonia uniflora]